MKMKKEGNKTLEAKMDIYVDDDTLGHEDHGHEPGHIFNIPKITIPETIEVEVGDHKIGHGLHSGYGHKHPKDSHPAGFLFELISDLPDVADGIWYSNSQISSGVLALFSLATLGFIIFKLLIFHKNKMRKRKRKPKRKPHGGGFGGPHAHFHHQAHISATPVVHNYISFDPHQSNIGYSSSSSKVKPPHRKRRRRKNRRKHHHDQYDYGQGSGWDRNGLDQEQSELSGHDIQQLVNYLKEQQHAQENDDEDDYYY